MENALKAKPEDTREQYESRLKALQDAYGESMLELRARKNGMPGWARRTRHDPSYPAGLPADGLAGAQESNQTSSSNRSIALGGDNTERAVGDRFVSRLGRS
jgi:hypothetical protein